MGGSAYLCVCRKTASSAKYHLVLVQTWRISGGKTKTETNHQPARALLIVSRGILSWRGVGVGWGGEQMKEHCYQLRPLPSSIIIIIIIIIIINPLTARVVGAPQMILQPVFSIFPVLH